MAREYDQITAFHYSAYRPPLHDEILKDSLAGSTEMGIGLDVGCGTGHSAIALANYCQKVFGIDPSREMLDKTILHPKIEYKFYHSNHFEFPKEHFDIITFAGSLYYAKSQALLDEVLRVIKSEGQIIVYDFKLSLDTILDKLELKSNIKLEPSYDYQINFTGLNQNKLKIRNRFEKSDAIQINMDHMSHLLLSSKDHYSLLCKSLGVEDLHDKISQKLSLIFNSESVLVETKTFSIIYQR